MTNNIKRATALRNNLTNCELDMNTAGFLSHITTAFDLLERETREKVIKECADIADEQARIFNNSIMHPNQIGRTILQLLPSGKDK